MRSGARRPADTAPARLRAPSMQPAAHAEELIERARRLGALADDLVEETEFGFLFNAGAAAVLDRLQRRPTAGSTTRYYDLLASEARLASFVAIAQGELPQEHWFALGRSLTPAGSARALLSWSGSMFEYLMPLLVMPRVRGHAARRDLPRGRSSGRSSTAAQRGVPWGISESGYNAQDAQRNYQYRAFGVPGLGLKRGLADDLVVAPYATLLALMVDAARRRARTCERLARRGPARAATASTRRSTTRRRGCRAADERASCARYMAHHQGMSLLALDNAAARPRRCSGASTPIRAFQAAELLLQERVPQQVPLIEPADRAGRARRRRAPARGAEPSARYATPHTPTPEVHLLSNGRYHVMVTNAGGGYSRLAGPRVTRWREDVTTRLLGQLLLRARRSRPATFWSTTHQPTLARRRRATRRSSRTTAPSSAAAIDEHRDAHRDRRLARRRRRAAPRVGSPTTAARARSSS